MACILVVDDEPGIRHMLAAFLSAEGHVVHLAANGAEGLAKLAEAAVDLVVTDLVMPVLPGVAMIEAMRREGMEQPIIAMSGGGGLAPGAPTASDAVRAGASVLLGKPFNLKQMLLLINRHLPTMNQMSQR